MPLDLDWEGDGLLGDDDFENGQREVIVIQDSQDEDEDEGFHHKEEEHMEIDLPVLPKPLERQDPQPRSSPLAGPSAIQNGAILPGLRPPPSRSSQLAVVLNSSPRRTPFTTISGDLSDDPLSMIKSDVPPKKHVKRAQQTSPANAAVIKPTTGLSITPQPKKRGRPVGWRAGSGPYTKLTGGSTPAPRPKPPKKPTGDRKKAGRPPAPTGRQVYLAQNPHFLVFKCEWLGCQAELHNTETLRKHLLLVHGRPPPSDSSAHSSSSGPNSSSSSELHSEKSSPAIICKWAKCRSAAATPRITFNASTFQDHAEEAHILPHLWLLGDGPQNTSCYSVPMAPLTGSKLPSYLFDSTNTIQVTPDVQNQQTENEEDRKRRQAKLNRILNQRDDNAPPEPEYTEEQVEDIARAMDEKKKRQKMFRDYAEKFAVAESLESAGIGVKKMKVDRGNGVFDGVKV